MPTNDNDDRTDQLAGFFAFCREWHQHHPAKTDAARQLTIDYVHERLAQLEADSELSIEVDTLGESYERRPIYIAKLGRGDRRVLLWSQMHGDEPSHTAVLLDLLDFLQLHAQHPSVRPIIDRCELWMVPMLSPDGAAANTRRNAQGIDINRDARNLASPEGRLLKSLVRDFVPQFGFNLHNQSTRRTVSNTRKVAMASLMAPPLAPGNMPTPSLTRAEHLAAIAARLWQRHAPGHVGRYKADYMARAFGEWVQSQGVSTMLIEVGGTDTSHAELLTMHFALLSSLLLAIATGAYEPPPAQGYYDIPLNGDFDRFDLALRRVQIGTTERGGRVDLGINWKSADRLSDGPLRQSTIVELGDLEPHPAAREIDGQHLAARAADTAFVDNFTPLAIPSHEAQSALARRGFATVVGLVDASDDRHVDALATMAQQPQLLHVAMMIDTSTLAAVPSEEHLRRIVGMVKLGATTIVVDDLNTASWLRSLLPESARLIVPAALPATSEQIAMGAARGWSLSTLPSPERPLLGRRADLAVANRFSPDAEMQMLLVDGHDVLDPARQVELPGWFCPPIEIMSN
jgi:hypothetical protein